tara:strand:- start:617 stop:1342 length:726 start_codon:yes stop_codon:yes gene_type:complete
LKAERIKRLSKTEHRDVHINVDYLKQPEAATHVVPVLVSELLSVTANYPTFLIKDSETGEFLLAALLGFAEDENLFMSGDGNWRSTHVPLTIARKPFHLSEDRTDVFIDMDNPWVSFESGERLFTDSGEFTLFMDKMLGMLERIASGVGETKSFVKTLLDYGLVKPVTLDLTFEDLQPRNLQGLYNIDHAKLRSLSQGDLSELHRRRILEGVFMVSHSLEKIKSLVFLKDRLNRKLTKVLG